MATVTVISPVTGKPVEHKRVAAYCRVSTNSADQQNSYNTQVRYYTRYIKSRTEWTLVDIFADEGLSGTSSEKRENFQRMITMCELKQIDLVVTKSVSRFARNVKETLEYVRKLKLLGIGVVFEKEATPFPWAMKCCSTPSRQSHRKNRFPSRKTFDSPFKSGCRCANMWTAMLHTGSD